MISEDFYRFRWDERLDGYKREIRNRYDNSVGYVDHLLALIFSSWGKELDEGRLIIVITGDHGEEFWDQGNLGHLSGKMTAQMTEVPLAIIASDIAPRQVPLSWHGDIMPTLFDLLDTADLPEISHYSNGISLLTDLPRKTVSIVEFGFPFSGRSLQLVEAEEKYSFVRMPQAFDRFGWDGSKESGGPLPFLDAGTKKKVEEELASRIPADVMTFVRWHKLHF